MILCHSSQQTEFGNPLGAIASSGMKQARAFLEENQKIFFSEKLLMLFLTSL
jgi:hypothetical protein